jgi:hypothetical protein
MNQGLKRFTISLLFAYFLAFLTELIEVENTRHKAESLNATLAGV